MKIHYQGHTYLKFNSNLLGNNKLSLFSSCGQDWPVLVVHQYCHPEHNLGLYSLRRRRLTGIGIPIINLRRSDNRFRLIMGIPILIRPRLLSEYRPRYVGIGIAFSHTVECPIAWWGHRNSWVLVKQQPFTTKGANIWGEKTVSNAQQIQIPLITGQQWSKSHGQRAKYLEPTVVNYPMSTSVDPSWLIIIPERGTGTCSPSSQCGACPRWAAPITTSHSWTSQGSSHTARISQVRRKLYTVKSLI